MGFSGFGIWLILRPGFGILRERRDEIRDCDYGRDTGFGDFNKLESGNVALKKPIREFQSDCYMWLVICGHVCSEQ